MVNDLRLKHQEIEDAQLRLSRKVSKRILKEIHLAGGGHFGGSLSVVDILLGLYAARPMRQDGAEGDRLLLSKAHSSMALYVVLDELGRLDVPIVNFGAFNSALQGHADTERLANIDFSFGALGQGIGVGIGMALGLKKKAKHVWVILGDGECQEGMIWESALIAARYKISNLHIIIDSNGHQECGWGFDSTLDPTPIPDPAEKWKAFGWRASEFDGHNATEILAWIEDSTRSLHTNQPSVGLARTNKRFTNDEGINSSRLHHTTLTDCEYANALRMYDLED
jgi:transketolase